MGRLPENYHWVRSSAAASNNLVAGRRVVGNSGDLDGQRRHRYASHLSGKRARGGGRSLRAAIPSSLLVGCVSSVREPAPGALLVAELDRERRLQSARLSANSSRLAGALLSLAPDHRWMATQRDLHRRRNRSHAERLIPRVETNDRAAALSLAALSGREP